MGKEVHVKGVVRRREFAGDRPDEVATVPVQPLVPGGLIEDIDPGDPTLIAWAWGTYSQREQSQLGRAAVGAVEAS